MSVKNRATISSDIATNLADNSAGLITPELLRNELDDLNDSNVNKTTDTNLMGVRTYDVTRLYYTNELTIYNGIWYQANADTVVGAFDATKWDALSNNVYYTAVTIETATVLAMNATPVEIVPAITGKTILVYNAFLTVTYNSVPYATNTTVQLITDTASIPQLEFLTGLNATVTRKSLGRLKNAAIAAGETQLIISKSLKVQTQTGEATAGNSQITVGVFYQVI